MAQLVAAPLLDALGSHAGLLVMQRAGYDHRTFRFVVDSNQGGVSGAYNPFTSSQGSWNCQPDNPVSTTALVLEFSLRGPLGSGQSIVRLDYQINRVQEEEQYPALSTCAFSRLTAIR
jgi:hypothetical protein